MEFTGEELIKAIQSTDINCEICGEHTDGEFATKLILLQNNAKFIVIVDGKESFFPEQGHNSFLIAQIKSEENQEMDWDLVDYLESKISDALQVNKLITVTHKPDSDIRIISHNGRDYFFSELPYFDSLIQMPDGTIYKPVFPGGPGIKPTFQRIGKAVRAFAT